MNEFGFMNESRFPNESWSGSMLPFNVFVIIDFNNNVHATNRE